MHGFPDNVHLYDRLVPWLTPSRWVITFDFLGWGSSDKPAGYPYTAANQVLDVDAVLATTGSHFALFYTAGEKRCAGGIQVVSQSALP
jgi:pimeloyl-ACP methyl ester carboxylesterase